MHQSNNSTMVRGWLMCGSVLMMAAAGSFITSYRSDPRNHRQQCPGRLVVAESIPVVEEDRGIVVLPMDEIGRICCESLNGDRWMIN